MNEIFILRHIKGPRLDLPMLKRAMNRLDKITLGWQNEGPEIPALLDSLREQLRKGLPRGKSFEECTAVPRREWLLLRLYLSDLSDQSSAEWLPPFDENVAISILGEHPPEIKKHLRRLATQLYFTHFGLKRLPCLSWLAETLRAAWRSAKPEDLNVEGLVWHNNADILFCKKAPDEVAKNWKEGMSVSELSNHFCITDGSAVKFNDRLYESIILKRLRDLPIHSSDHSLNQLVIKEKERTLRTGKTLGSSAVEILITRSQKENSSEVPKSWRDHIVTYACDPRIPNSEMQQRWWGWANSKHKDIAIRALIELSLEEFIKLLEQSLRGTDAQLQFPKRRKMLLDLMKNGKVQDARLIVNSDFIHRLDTQTKNVLRPSWVDGGPQHTSFICLQCTDDVFLIEGTHSFSLRGFIGPNSFPVKGFWSNAPKGYHDSEFRVKELKCSIYQRHLGDWVWYFINQLRQHNIEWRGLR